MGIKDIINLKSIVFNFYQSDISKLLSMPDYNIRLEDKERLLTAATSLDTQDLYETIKFILEKNLSAEQFDLSIMLTLFLQRYNYFHLTNQEWDKYLQHVEKSNLKDSPEFRLDCVTAFFDNQINLYTNNYINLIEQYEVKEWNIKFYQDLKSLAATIAATEDFYQKLSAVEKMILFLQNTKNIYIALEGVGVEDRKREFLAHSNELKIVFQSMDNILKEILTKLT